MRFGVESQFRVNNLSHMLIVRRLSEQLREGTGRVVMVSSSAAQSFVPQLGILFDDLEWHRDYRPFPFYGQSKLANLTFAKSMAERLQPRGIISSGFLRGRLGFPIEQGGAPK